MYITAGKDAERDVEELRSSASSLGKMAKAWLLSSSLSASPLAKILVLMESGDGCDAGERRGTNEFRTERAKRPMPPAVVVYTKIVYKRTQCSGIVSHDKHIAKEI